jgi:hypothetical protein
MRTSRAAISFLDIGRRLNSIDLEYGTLEEAQMAMPEGSEEYSAAHARLVALTDEQTALQDLALVMQPKTLSDAAVQLGILTDAVTEICVPDLGSLLQSGDLANELAKLRRVLAGITPVVAAVAGLDQKQGRPPEATSYISGPGQLSDEPAQDSGAAPDRGGSEVLSLCSAYHALNELRADIDERIMAQPSDTSCCDELWPELGPVLARLDNVVKRLAKTRAIHMIELHAKAVVLATLLRSDDTGRDSVIPSDKAVALALSLAEDVIGFPE